MSAGFTASPPVPLVNEQLDIHYCAPVPAEIKAEVVVDHFPFVLGRHPECDVALFSRQVSRRHCQFFRRGDEVWLEDLNSYNGTYLNDREVRQAEPVHDGDVLTLHPYRYRCRVETDPAAATVLRLIPDGITSSP